MCLSSIIVSNLKDEEGYFRPTLQTKEGHQITNVTSFDYHIDADDLVGRATVQLITPETYFEAKASYTMYDFVESKVKEVSKVVFKDGTELNLEDVD